LLGYSADHTGAFSHVMLFGEGDNPEAVYEKFKVYVETVKKNGVEKAVVERIKKTIYANLVRTFDNTDRIANNLISNLFDGVDLFDVPAVVAAITVDDVNNLVREIFSPERYAIAMVKPL